VVASRFAIELKIGRQLETGEHALHSCDNPPCVNPAHLWVGSIADNNADASRKGRMAKRLTATQVAEIRTAMAGGAIGPDLAARYGVAHSTVYRVRNRQTWRHS
jgi:hypothetical protein